ncbi:hypothetical protein diail_4664 [Diaporthe ilicicola]|nr:hypothetical protein diail_4664 [Diaporthe ilicicola]
MATTFERQAAIERAFDELLDKYNRQWEGTPTVNPYFCYNREALEVIFNQPRFRSLTKIIVLGFENPGTLDELRLNVEGRLDRNLELRQRTKFKQIVTCLQISRIICRNGRAAVSVYVHDHNLTPDTIAGINHLGLAVVNDHEAGERVSHTSLIYDVSRNGYLLHRHVHWEWVQRDMLPLVILTDYMGVESTRSHNFFP